MDWQGWFTVALTVAVLATLITVPRLGTDVVLMGALLLLGATGILTPDEALAGFANTGLMTVAAMFVIAAGIRASGGVDLVVEKVLGKPTGPRHALVRLMVPVVGLSAFLNNTPVVATMIPAVSQWARRIRVPSSTLMIPLSYASILGGTITLIGTSTNLVVNGQYQALTGKPGFALFDIAPLGLIVAAAGTLFVVIVAPKLLRVRRSPDQTFADTRKFTFEVAVAQDGPMVGKTIQQASLRNLERIYLAEIERDGGVITAVAPEEILRGGDRLVFVGETEAIVDILRINGLVPAVGSKPALERHVPERRLVEAVVAEHCEVVGQTIRDGRFRDLYGAVVLAVARNGEHIRGRLSSIILEPGDLLLLEARPAVVNRLKHSRDFLLMNVLEHELPDHSHAWISWGILVAIVALATSGVLSMLYAGLFGVAAMLATGCISTNEARRSLDLPVLVTIAASFALGNALEKTGAASFLGNGIVGFAGGNPWLLLALVYLSVMMLTEMITNNAAAMLMLPVALAVAQRAGLHDVPYVMAVMMAASASFATPIGYQCNLMVYGPGGYRFSDFLRIGIPMNCLVAAVTIAAIPLIWPLHA
ncbi:MAG: anion permease [Pseudomonadales bacterium]|jgi:di/tricarboxylate transporter|nr:anion permease [Pseudomonadales bacterium]MCP5321799.1 anion permease [Pseudomonadales bacterium]